MNEEYEGRNTGSNKIWIVALVVIGILIWQYGGENSSARTSDIKYDEDSGTFSRGEEVDESEQTEEDTVTTENSPVTNECGYEDFGMADYEGTTAEGKTCADFIDSDNECLANPPKNYDGYIDRSIAFSDPMLTCCKKDGTCQWA